LSNTGVGKCFPEKVERTNAQEFRISTNLVKYKVNDKETQQMNQNE